MKDVWLLPGVGGKSYSFPILDLGTGFRMSPAVDSMDTDDTVIALKYFIGDDKDLPEVKRVYSDNWSSYAEACKILRLMRQTSLPGLPKTNARAERIV